MMSLARMLVRADVREHAQHLVADGVAEAVIDRFEMIEIEHQQRHRLAAFALMRAQAARASRKARRLSSPVR